MFANEPHLQHFRAIQIVHAVPLFQPLKCSTFLLFSQVLLSCVSKVSFTRPRLMKNSKNSKNNFLLLSILMFPFSHQYFQTRSSNENSRILLCFLLLARRRRPSGKTRKANVQENSQQLPAKSAARGNPEN